MPKTLVNIVTDDNPIPAYLFIKEKYEAGDRLMFISAKSTEDDLSFLSEQEQRWVFEAAQELRYKLTMNSVKLFRDSASPLTKELICGMMQGAQSEIKPKVPVRKVSVSRSVYDRYFKGSTENEIQSVIDQALAAWFAASHS